MTARHLISAALVLAALAPAARAADTTVAADPDAQEVAALDGKVAWISGPSGHQRLMGVDSPPQARAYRSIDLGRDARGRLVLTYLRCRTFSHCTAFRDDLAGHRKPFRGLAPHRCSLTTAPAVWGRRLAYGVACRDARRSGLYVDGRRRPLPRDAVRFGADEITAVDLRGARVAAVASDVYEYAFSQTVAGRQRHAFLAAASEGDSDEHARGLSLGRGGALWALTDAEHAGDPNVTVVFRSIGACVQHESLQTAAGPDQESSFRATDLAVDGAALYLVVPGTGIVRHDFAPEHPC